MALALHERLAQLRQRIDALKEGRAPEPGLFGGAFARLSTLDGPPALESVHALDRELDRIGIHTAADARLLRDVGLRRGPLFELASGLSARAKSVVEELDDATRAVERAMAANRLPPGAVSALDRAWPKAVRALKTANIFAEPVRAPADEPTHGRTRRDASASIRPGNTSDGPDPSRSSNAGDDPVNGRGPRPDGSASAGPGRPEDRGSGSDDAGVTRSGTRDDELLSGPRASSASGVRPDSARVAIAAFWSERARVNEVDLAARRRELDAAHELLLRIGSESDRDLVRALRMEVSDARARAADAPPARTLDDLLSDVRRVVRRDPKQAYRALRALHERAVEAGDGALAQAATNALRPFVDSDERAKEAFERGASSVVPRKAEAVPASQSDADAQLLELMLDAEGAREQFELAEGCARFFDVESAVGESVLVAEVPKQSRPAPRRVPYPTERLEFDLATGLHEVRDFVVTDPRRILMDLASGRQWVRAYVEEAPESKPRHVRRTAVRVYVCDASGSMLGARARFRDALVLAELNEIRRKAKRGEPFDPLYFTFFNDRPSELQRVDDLASASRAIQKLLAQSPASGQTDITLALCGAFDSIRAARGTDPYLARATVVLVTDGEDRVDVRRLRAARAPVDAVQISMSFIALGEENRDLRALVKDQRAEGGRAFYVHLSDREIALAPTEFDARLRTLWPRDLPVDRVAFEALEPHLDALEALAAGRAQEASSQRAPLGPSFDAVFPEELAVRAERARSPSTRAPPDHDPDVLRVVDIVDAIAEAAGLAPADARARECVVLLVHLLGLYGLSLAKYVEVIERGDARICEAIARVRLITPYGESLLQRSTRTGG